MDVGVMSSVMERMGGWELGRGGADKKRGGARGCWVGLTVALGPSRQPGRSDRPLSRWADSGLRHGTGMGPRPVSDPRCLSLSL